MAKLLYIFGVHHLKSKDAPAYIPRNSDMCRSYGIKWAYDNTDSRYFLTLDDDVMPQQDPFERYEYWFKRGAPVSEYFDVGLLTTSDKQMRGFPYKDRARKPVAVQYGGWNGVLDYDAATQLSTQPKDTHLFWFGDIVVPKGAAVTGCIMNCAWQREYTPIMWQLPLLDGRYNRVGDIWSGLFIKKTLDAIGAAMVINGQAQVYHDRASNAYRNLEREASSAEINDHLWENLHVTTDERWTQGMLEAYREVVLSAVEYIETKDRDYARHLLECTAEWLESFE